MTNKEKIALFEQGGLFKFTFKDDLSKKENLFGRVIRVTTNGTKTQKFIVVENENLMQFLGKDDRGNPKMKKLGTHQLSYNGFLNIKYLDDVERIKD